MADRGITSVAVNLTSQGDDVTVIGDLRSDVALLRDTIANVAGPVVVLSHSAYGGMVTSEAADGLDNVSRLIYLTSFVPEVGESLSGIFGSSGPPPFVVASNGLLTVKEGWGRRLFYTNSTEEVALESERKLQPQAAVTFGQEVGAAAWRKIPSSYVICTEDQAMSKVGQRRMADRIGGDAVELPGDHCSFLSQPKRLAELITERF